MGMNGRVLLVGYAEDIANDGAPITPSPAVYGNFSIAGVCLAYASDPLAVRPGGMNFPSRSDGLEIHERVLELLRTKKVRTVVTEEIGFDELPAALERQHRRETMGRVVVSVR